MAAPPARGSARGGVSRRSATAAGTKISTEKKKRHKRGEVLMGLRREIDGKPLLNPPKEMKLKRGASDKLVLLGNAF